ncbi:MAG: PAS domain S-box protein [Planctomycetes bacterium]|nr:PAS domain S-box protein [Planctomycetota bacterium]
MTFPDYLLTSVLEQSPVGMVWTDLEGIVLYVNPHFCGLSGYTPDELTGQSVELVRSDRQSESFHENLWETIRGGQEWVGRFDNKRKDGSIYSVKATITPIRHPETGEISHYASTHEDLTQYEELRKSLRQSQRFESLGVLAGGMAHEFNNILTPIFGYLDLIRSASPNPQAQRYVDHAERAAERARQLIAQILAFSRQVSPGDEQVDLRLVIKESLKLVRSLFPSNVEISCEVGEAALTAVVNPAQVHQSLLNLYTNAYHAFEGGDGVLKVQASHVDFDTGAAVRVHPEMSAGRYVRVVVSDTGCGMEPEVLDHAFDPFFTTKPQGEGTGLGLAEARGIFEEAGGAISAESELGVGSTFTVHLPCALTSEGTRAEPPAAARRGSEEILFVDDDPEIAAMGKELLELQGYEVTAKTNSVEALVAIREGGQFDLLITDQTMPHLTGTQLAHEVHAVHPGLPVLLITGFSETVSAENFAELGLSGYMRKPLAPRELAATIRRILDRSCAPPSSD